MTDEKSAMVKHGVWGSAIGAVIAIVLGFTLGGWVTASSAKELSDDAVLASQSAICVAQFVSSPNYDAELVKFQETDSWKRRELVQTGGWDKMPGEENAGTFVARACADGIERLFEN